MSLPKFRAMPPLSPAQETKLFERGCLLVFLGIVLLGLLTWFVHKAFFVGIVLLAVGWSWICRVRMKKEKSRLFRAFKTAFESFTGTKPVLNQKSSYGFAVFEITFESQKDFEQAVEHGQMEVFKNSIVELYGHTGSKGNPFDVNMSVQPTYPGRWDHLSRNAADTGSSLSP